MTLPQLAEHIRFQTAASKMELPWLKLALFGNKRSEKNCLRTNANTLQISGVEVEHDAGEICRSALRIATIRKAQIRALLYTSPSYVPGDQGALANPGAAVEKLPARVRARRWSRASTACSPASSQKESFVLSQSYYYGSVNNNPDHRVEVIDGKFLDLRDDLYAGSIFKDGSRVGDQAANGSPSGGGHQQHRASRADDDPEPVDRDKIEAALDVIDSNCPYFDWLKVAAALHYAFGESGFEMFDRWSAKARAIYKADESRKRWRGARTMTDISTGTIFYYADQANPGWRDRYLLERMNNAFGASTGGEATDANAAPADSGNERDAHEGRNAMEGDEQAASDDATGADAGNEKAAADDWDDSEDDERVANEAPVAQTLPVIKVHKRISRLTTEAQQMLIDAKVPFYQRGGELVRPIVRTVKAAHGHLTKTAQLKNINPVYMRDTMCRHAHWVRFDGRRMEWVPTMAPMNVAETLLARDGVWTFDEIVGVIACPTMRPDGSLLVKQGYDKATRLLLIEPPVMPQIPDEPTRDDAFQALALLEELVCEVSVRKRGLQIGRAFRSHHAGSARRDDRRADARLIRASRRHRQEFSVGYGRCNIDRATAHSGNRGWQRGRNREAAGRRPTDGPATDQHR